MTPIFYHPKQTVESDFISINKVPEFVARAGRRVEGRIDAATRAQLLEVHDPSFVVGVLNGEIKNGFKNYDMNIALAARYSVGNMVAAVEHVLRSPDTVACSATQGFHHAHHASCYGYCTFNGLMVAALAAPTRRPVLIIDGDAHSGDGTDDIIQHLGLADRVVNVDRALLSRGVQPDWEFIMWRQYFRQWIRDTDPGIILYQAGADAWCEDPFGSGYLTLERLADRDRGIFTAAFESRTPLVWNLAGGYSERTVDIHLQTLRVCDEVYYGETVVPAGTPEVNRTRKTRGSRGDS